MLREVSDPAIIPTSGTLNFGSIGIGALVKRKWDHGEYISILLKNKHLHLQNSSFSMVVGQTRSHHIEKKYIILSLSEGQRWRFSARLLQASALGKCQKLLKSISLGGETAFIGHNSRVYIGKMNFSPAF